MEEARNIGEDEASVYLKVIVFVISGVFLIIGVTGFGLYKKVYMPNVIIKDKKNVSIYIPTGSTYEDFTNILFKDSLLNDTSSFLWAAEKKNLRGYIHPGRYILKNKMNNKQLISMFSEGKQTPVKVIFQNLRTKEQFASTISKQIEADSASIIYLLNDEKFLSGYNLNSRTAVTVFIPNTYEFYWNTFAEGFFKKMYKEYLKFWDKERISKLNKTGFSQVEAITLASIVDEEALRNDEMPRIAGVFINRLEKKIPLQADPTIRFALNDFTIKRIRKKHLEINSPYNTYKKYGLPPGPIAFSSIAAIDAVLDYEKHSYLYFCAKEDFSGYHNFATTLEQHNANARKYQKALNKMKIYK